MPIQRTKYNIKHNDGKKIACNKLHCDQQKNIKKFQKKNFISAESNKNKIDLIIKWLRQNRF